MWLIGGVAMLLFWAGVIALAYFAIRAVSRQGQASNRQTPPPARPETPLEILQARYARGEITREEYQAMRQDLEA
jgi:putative membrane protein